MKISKRKNKFYNTERFGQPEIRVYHKKGWGKKMPRYLLKCGCCDEKLEIYYERVFTSEQIHRSLASKNQQQRVWIGLRGVYALKEWGFIKPDKGLCQTVFEIVNSGFNKTAKPVTLSHIYKEIGNYRKIVNENSLYFACNFNPRVRVLKKGIFVPVIKNVDSTSKKDMKFLNDLDKQFRKNT